MVVICRLMRGVVVALLFFFSSTGCSKSPPQWKYDTIPQLNMERKYTSTNSELDPLSVDIFQGDSKTYVYLNLHHIPLSREEEEVAIRVDDIEVKTKGRVLAGGQKILLPEEETKMMLEALSQNRRVTIGVALYSKVLESFSNNL